MSDAIFLTAQPDFWAQKSLPGYWSRPKRRSMHLCARRMKLLEAGVIMPTGF